MMKAMGFRIVLLSALFLLVGCSYGGRFNDAQLDVPRIAVTSPSILDGKLMTVTAANRAPNNPLGENQSPALKWDSVEDANYYAVILFDEDANWLHFFRTDITATELAQGEFSDVNSYIGPYPPVNSGAHTYRIEVFAIKEQPKDTIGKLNARNSYEGIVNHLNQVGNQSNNILARGYVIATYKNGDDTTGDSK